VELTYLGLSCIRLRGRDATVVVDPPSAALPGLAKATPDIVVRTDATTDADKLRPREGHAQEVSGPGEFEVRGVSIFGMPTGETTVMRVDLDEIRIVAAGRLQRQLTEDEIDALGHVDVLVVPVGGGDALSAGDATKLVSAIEPSIVVPARYRVPGGAGAEYEPVDKFAKEMGLAEGAWQSQPKLSLSGPPGESDETKLVILEPRGA